MQEIFLFHNKIAIRATEENKQVFEKQKEQLQKANIEKKKIAENLIIKAPDSVIIFREASEQGAFWFCNLKRCNKRNK